MKSPAADGPEGCHPPDDLSGYYLSQTAGRAGGLFGIIGAESGVQAFNATTGKHVWTFTLPASPGPEAQPTVANGIVYWGCPAVMCREEGISTTDASFPVHLDAAAAAQLA
jgi:outer membrane protein assembly factor BamB